MTLLFEIYPSEVSTTSVKKEHETYLCSCRELCDERLCRLLESVEEQGERAGAVSQIQQLLQEQEAVGARVRCARRCHRS